MLSKLLESPFYLHVWLLAVPLCRVPVDIRSLENLVVLSSIIFLVWWYSQCVIQSLSKPCVRCVYNHVSGGHAASKRDRRCTCTIILFRGHSSCILQLLAFIRQKQEWIHQLIHTENRKRLGRVGTHRHAAMAQNAMYSILYLYIYLYNIYKTTVRPKQMPDTSFYTITEQRQTNFFFNKKNYFCSFLCKSATELK